MAPGHWTYSALPDGTVRDTFPVQMPDGTIREAPASGTSMATPHVAGAMALYLQANPGATFDQVMQALKRSGNLFTKPNEEQGYGIVQVDKLITPETIAAGAVRTDQKRVDELMAQFAKGQVFKEGERKPGPPTKPTAEPAFAA
jgi:subtilisin family serine protease